ncbi:MAG: phosphatidate cytidylyltransferase [Oscillospiraceae bacterium]
MKTRIMSALIGLVILAMVLTFFHTVVLNIAVAIISLIAVYELFHATGVSKNKLMSIVCYAVTVIIPFLDRATTVKYISSYFLPFVGVLFIILLFTHHISGVEHLAMAVLFTLAIPFSLCSAIYLRDIYGVVGGIFYICLALGGGWLSDSGAYFVGIKFGKKPLAPKISPKKTVEGAIGGIVCCTLGYLIISYLYYKGCQSAGLVVTINYLFVLLLAPIASVLSIAGDLSASIIKREYNVKDFGNIMPGHGGVMDRFDSVLFVFPLVYLLATRAPILVFG